MPTPRPGRVLLVVSRGRRCCLRRAARLPRRRATSDRSSELADELFSSRDSRPAPAHARCWPRRSRRTTAVLGTGLAWLVTRTDLPAPARLCAVLAPLPLVFPSFVGALALLAALVPGRSGRRAGSASAAARVEGFAGAWLVLTLFTYPYVYLPVAARLRSLPPSLEESARLLGRRPFEVFRTVVLPQIAGAIRAGALLVFLYIVSDFGAVQLLRYDTLTRAHLREPAARPRPLARARLLLAVAGARVVAVERAVGSAPARHRGACGARRAAAGAARALALARAGRRCRRARSGAGRAAVVARLLGVARARRRARRPVALGDRGWADLGQPTLEHGVGSACVDRGRRGGRRAAGRLPHRPLPVPGRRRGQRLVVVGLRAARPGHRAVRGVLGAAAPERLAALYQTLRRCWSSPTSSTSVRRRCGPPRSRWGGAPPARRRRPHARRRPGPPVRDRRAAADAARAWPPAQGWCCCRR